jgi:hypothetical protein
LTVVENAAENVAVAKVDFLVAADLKWVTRVAGVVIKADRSMGTADNSPCTVALVTAAGSTTAKMVAAGRANSLTAAVVDSAVDQVAGLMPDSVAQVAVDLLAAKAAAASAGRALVEWAAVDLAALASPNSAVVMAVSVAKVAVVLVADSVAPASRTSVAADMATAAPAMATPVTGAGLMVMAVGAKPAAAIMEKWVVDR